MRGFTLAEVLVSMLILGFLVAAMHGVLSVGNTIYKEDAALIGLQQQARQAMDIMVNEIRESKPSEIALSANNTKATFNITGAVYDGPWIGPISYYRDIDDDNNDGLTGQLIREYPQGSMRILAGDIAALSFSLSGNTTEISLAAEKTVRGKTYCFPSPCGEPRVNLKETIRLRNE
ncbi:MAG: type II secretion system protein [Candidatus Omnitrophota bacterium]|jgi:prepilin-type N-terminal cleavage/methylation domain-containing protein